jgi:hypothetical protein
MPTSTINPAVAEAKKAARRKRKTLKNLFILSITTRNNGNIVPLRQKSWNSVLS